MISLRSPISNPVALVLEISTNGTDTNGTDTNSTDSGNSSRSNVIVKIALGAGI
eukprot:Awhi_evm1s13313